MPKKRSKELVVAQFFRWRLGKRGDVFFADGRSNRVNAGRHSLGTRDHDQALDLIHELDRVRAIDLGLADPSVIQATEINQLPLAIGRKLYESHVSRPPVVGGARAPTSKRYRAIFNKFVEFAASQDITSWNRVNKATLESYAERLDKKGYAYATQYIELTTIKQAINWFVEEGHLPKSCQFRMPMSKPDESTAYCYTVAQVRAMIAHCRAQDELHWLSDIICALAYTGLRISELASLRRSDVDFERNIITLVDETKNAHRRRGKARQTKGGYSRSFPTHCELRPILELLPNAEDGLLFHGPKGGVLKPDTVRNILVREVLNPLSKVFVTPKDERGFADGRLHSFRHFFCSLAANRGVPEQTLMRWLGHRSSQMVRRYYHLHDEESQRHMRRLSLSGEDGGTAAGDVEGSDREATSAKGAAS